MTDYQYILSKNYSGKNWSMNGDEYEGFTWLEDSEKPTKDQLDKEYVDYKNTFGYIDNRKNHYPATDDLVIALWEKFMDHKNDPADLIQKKRQEIKKKFPKEL